MQGFRPKCNSIKYAGFRFFGQKKEKSFYTAILSIDSNQKILPIKIPHLRMFSVNAEFLNFYIIFF